GWQNEEMENMMRSGKEELESGLGSEIHHTQEMENMVRSDGGSTINYHNGWKQDKNVVPVTTSRPASERGQDIDARSDVAHEDMM
ncbi:hypothetical protein Tco_0334383, partial [Tanacetum coccineum]